jgi:hypothetical protein
MAPPWVLPASGLAGASECPLLFVAEECSRIKQTQGTGNRGSIVGRGELPLQRVPEGEAREAEHLPLSNAEVRNEPALLDTSPTADSEMN